MDFEFPPDTLMLRDMLRRFIQKEARPLEMKYFTAGALDSKERAHLQQAIQQMGLWGLMVPEQFGGGGLDLLTSCVIEEELGGTFIPIETGEVPALLYACQGDQIDRFLEPALAGERRAILAAREPRILNQNAKSSIPEGWTTIATSCNGSFLLKGRKVLSIQPEPQDFFIVLANTSPSTKATQISAFLLDAQNGPAALSVDGEITLSLEDYPVVQDSLLGAPGEALLIGAAEAPKVWIRLGARYVGMVERLIEMSVAHAREWVSLGAPLSTRPAIQRMLAELRVEVESARWLVYHAAWLADSGKGEPLRGAAAQVRLATGEMLQRAIDRVTMIFAGPGPSPQIEPYRLVKGSVPPEALAFALDQARAIITAEMLDLPEAANS